MQGEWWGQGRGPSSLEDPQAFSGVSSWQPGLGRVFNILLFALASSLALQIFSQCAGHRPHLHLLVSPSHAFCQFFSFSLEKVVKLACGVLPSSRALDHHGVTLSRPTWWVRLRLLRTALAP